VQLLSKGSWWGGIHRIKQHLAHAKGNIKACKKVLDDLKVEMLGHIGAYQAGKAKNRKMQKEIGKGALANDPQDRIPSFEESCTFPIDPYATPFQKNHPREEVELVGGSSSGSGTSNVKRTHTNLESFFVPCTIPGAQPTIDAKWKKMEKDVAWECIAR